MIYLFPGFFYVVLRVWSEEKENRDEKKCIVCFYVGLAALVFCVSTANAQDLSVGYQGLLGTGTNMLSGLSIRGWSDAIGYEGTHFLR